METEKEVNLNVVQNMLCKLDENAQKYYTKPNNQNLIDFIHYRMDYLELTYKFLALNKLVDSHTSWMLQCYCGVVTDELKIFDNGDSVSQPEFVMEIKQWREHLR